MRSQTRGANILITKLYKLKATFKEQYNLLGSKFNFLISHFSTSSVLCCISSLGRLKSGFSWEAKTYCTCWNCFATFWDKAILKNIYNIATSTRPPFNKQLTFLGFLSNFSMFPNIGPRRKHGYTKTSDPWKGREMLWIWVEGRKEL